MTADDVRLTEAEREALAEVAWLLDGGDASWGWANLYKGYQSQHRLDAEHFIAPAVERIIAARLAAQPTVTAGPNADVLERLTELREATDAAIEATSTAAHAAQLWHRGIVKAKALVEARTARDEAIARMTAAHRAVVEAVVPVEVPS